MKLKLYSGGKAEFLSLSYYLFFFENETEIKRDQLEKSIKCILKVL
jgi:hypothetical protein